MGTKRFSIEGVAATIPLLASIAESPVADGARELVLGTTHGGRLNIMAHFVKKAPEQIFVQFEDLDPRNALGSHT